MPLRGPKNFSNLILRLLATLPLADEIIVFPSTILRGTSEDAPYSFAFGLPVATKGLKFICRESFDDAAEGMKYQTRFFYTWDPDAHSVELYTGDYLSADPDCKPIRWKLRDPRRQMF